MWEELDASRAWSVCMRAILAAFYSHPWAWNEIGYGGPAYPQGYMRLGPISALEPHERPARPPRIRCGSPTRTGG